MISIPAFFLLVPFAIFVVVVLFLGSFNVGHLVRTGTATFVSIFFSLLFFIAVGFILLITWNLLGGIDWMQPVQVWNPEWINGSINVEI